MAQEVAAGPLGSRGEGKVIVSIPSWYFDELPGGSGVPLTVSQKKLIDAAVKDGVSPRRAVAEYVALPNYPLAGHRPVDMEFIVEGEPFIQSVLVGYVPI